MARDGAATTEPPFSVRLDRGSAVQRASIGIVQRAVEDWLAVARHPRFDRPYDELTYRPMQELLALLRARGFRTWIVSGGGADFMRVWSERVRRPAVGEPPAPARLVFNDATNVYRLPDGTFEMYSVGLIKVAKDDPRYIAHDNAAGSLRVIDRYTSTDGLDWTDRRRVLVPDAQDPIDQQFYYLAVTHTPQGRVGMLGHYRVAAQTVDLEACVSTDGNTWQRPRRRGRIPRGEPGEPDSYGISAPHALVRRDGLWHLVDTGVNEAHNHRHSHGTPTRTVMHATDGACGRWCRRRSTAVPPIRARSRA
jgi:hypothetical protein